MIGSAADHKTIIIEKTPDDLDIYDPQQDHIVCTNHYQSKELGKQALNKEQMDGSASVYRYKRTQQLLDSRYPLTPEKAASILRDQKGLEGIDIGVGNEKAINQMIAHHSIIFMPDSLRFWISTGPWQLGEYVCYDLKKIFAMKGLAQDIEIASNEWNIAPDSFINTETFNRFLKFRNAKMTWMDRGEAYKTKVGDFIINNPEYYDAYRLAGDYYLKAGNYKAAQNAYSNALTKVIATEGERTMIEEKLEEAKQKGKETKK